MTANKSTIRAILRTQLQQYVKQNARGQHATMESLADEVISNGGVDRDMVFQLFGRSGFLDWLRREASKVDPTTGRPMLTAVAQAVEEDEDGEPRMTQKMLYISTKWADFDGRVFDFKQKIRTHERDRRAARLLWQGILEDFPNEARRPDSYKPPLWLFDLDEDAGAAC